MALYTKYRRSYSCPVNNMEMALRILETCDIDKKKTCEREWESGMQNAGVKTNTSGLYSLFTPCKMNESVCFQMWNEACTQMYHHKCTLVRRQPNRENSFTLRTLQSLQRCSLEKFFAVRATKYLSEWPAQGFTLTCKSYRRDSIAFGLLCCVKTRRNSRKVYFGIFQNMIQNSEPLILDTTFYIFESIFRML